MDVFGYLESQKYRYHLDTADIWNGFLPSTDESYLRKVRAAIDERGLALVNLAVDGAHIYDPDESIRQKHYENALAHLRAAEILGARSIRIDMGGQESEMTDAQFELVVRRYQEYCHIARESGFVVGPENHFGPSLIPDNMRRVAEAVDHPAYKILLHVGRWREDAEFGDAFCAERAMHIHLDAHVIAHNLEEKIKLLINKGYTGCWGIEEGSGQAEYAAAEWAVGAVKRALAEIAGNGK